MNLIYVLILEIVLNARVYQFENCAVEVVHDPITNLSKDLQDELVIECTELSRDSFGNPDIQEEVVRNCILNASVVLFGRDYEGKLFGYSSNDIKTMEGYYIIYLQAVAISKKLQGMGLRPLLHAIKVLEDIKKIKDMDISLNHVLVAGRTQNPIAYRYNTRYLGMFPQPDGTIDPTIRKMGKKIAYSICRTHHDESDTSIVFDDSCFVQRGAYKNMTTMSMYGVYPEGVPYCCDNEVNHYMNQHLDRQNGDALIQVGYYQEDIIHQMFEDAKRRMGFQGVYEVAPEELAAAAV